MIKTGGDQGFGPNKIKILKPISVGATYEVTMEMDAPAVARDTPYFAEYQVQSIDVRSISNPIKFQMVVEN